MSPMEEIAACEQTEAMLKPTLPQLDTLMSGKDLDEAVAAMTALFDAQARLDSGESLSNKEAHDLMHITMRKKLELESIQYRLGLDGFRHGQNIFAVVHRVIAGKHNFVRIAETLPDEVK